jgi:transposase InsO family protein
VYAAIDQIVVSESVAASHVCDMLQVSRSGFYAWRRNELSSREVKDQALIPIIQDIFWSHRRRYGARRIAAELRRRDILCGVGRVAKLLKSQGLRAIQPKSFKPKTTESRHRLGYNDNLLADRPAPSRINEVWVGDITYIPLRTGRFGYTAFCSTFTPGESLAGRTDRQ